MAGRTKMARRVPSRVARSGASAMPQGPCGGLPVNQLSQLPEFGGGKLQAERLDDLQDRSQFRVPLWRKRFIKAFTPQAGLSSNAAHSFCTGDIAQRCSDEHRVSILEGRIQISGHIPFIAEVSRDIPAAGFGLRHGRIPTSSALVPLRSECPWLECSYRRPQAR